jgi:hypothetical protein
MGCLVPFLIATAAALLAPGCAISHPCQEAGEPAREVPFKGNKQCTQHQDPSGHYVNDGQYREWHPNGKLALDGRYKMGRRDGKWKFYDPEGRQNAERNYEDGIEVALPRASGDQTRQ